MKKVMQIVISWDDIRDALIKAGLIAKEEWPSKVSDITTAYSAGPKCGLSWDISSTEDLAK